LNTHSSEKHRQPIVLVVDDNSDIRDLIALYSQALGCLPMKAANGEEALEKLKGDPKPDLIFLDLMMPVMNGWQTEHLLALDPVLSKIPTVIITGYAEKAEKLDRNLEVVHKPVTIETLKHFISRYCLEKLPV
jgi:CheY-like chemotaxis protein